MIQKADRLILRLEKFCLLSAEEKQAIEKMAADVAGTDNVDSQLEIKSE